MCIRIFRPQHHPRPSAPPLAFSIFPSLLIILYKLRQRFVSFGWRFASSIFPHFVGNFINKMQHNFRLIKTISVFQVLLLKPFIKCGRFSWIFPLLFRRLVDASLLPTALIFWKILIAILRLHWENLRKSKSKWMKGKFKI